MHAAYRKMERNKKKNNGSFYWLKKRYNINIYTHFFF